MANFKYKGISADGEDIRGVVEAPDQFEAVAKIRQTCFIIEEIEQVTVQEKGFAKRIKKIDAKTLSVLCNRFATILGVGLPIVQAVDMLAGQMEDKYVSQMLREVSKDVAGTQEGAAK